MKNYSMEQSTNNQIGIFRLVQQNLNQGEAKISEIITRSDTTALLYSVMD
jgi:hypothetical protein